jgi:hypothetical protein
LITNVFEIKEKLAETWGSEFGRICRLVCNLADNDWHSIPGLIQKHALSHRTVVGIVKLFDPWLDNEEKVRFSLEYVNTVRSVFGCKDTVITLPLSDIYKAAARDHTILLESIKSIQQNLPGENLGLDHVLTTPLTSVKRSLFLTQNYDLAASKILLLGDHDMTSLALAQTCPDICLTVVDVDERLLAYINELSVQNGWNIRTVFADLRIGLPKSLQEQFDLVFTDPPYTPLGIRLFLRRALESLRPLTFSRIIFCYGFGEQHPTLGLKVQREIFRLCLVLEAILPHFNHYVRAQAIGSSSDLYICRPTRKTYKIISKPAETVSRIYTHGQSSEESSVARIPTELLETMQQHTREYPAQSVTLVGKGWPEDWSSRHSTISISRYVADVLNRAKNLPFTKPLHAGLVAVNLHPHFDAYFIRILLISNAPHLLVVTTREAFRESDIHTQRIIANKYSIQVDSIGQSVFITATKITLDELDPVGYVLRYLLDHQRACVHNAWREALISWASKKSIRVTKNQARNIVEQGIWYKLHQGSYLSELSVSALEMLVTKVERTIQEVDGLSLQEAG